MASAPIVLRFESMDTSTSAPKPRRSSVQTPGKPGDTGTDALVAEIAGLDAQSIEALRVSWARRFHCPAPPIRSPDTLRRLFAWKLQAEVLGDLDAETVKVLRQAQMRVKAGKSPGTTAGPQLRTGMILVREWRGTMHRVLVLDSEFEHDGKRYRTLSEVARKIAGTHWSGPRFFGLTTDTKPAQAESAESEEVAR